MQPLLFLDSAFSEAHAAADDMLDQICAWLDGREESRQTNCCAPAKKQLPVAVPERIQDAHKNRTALDDPAFPSLVY